nr:MAG TPA: hypothetical protein [Caudoviricetes sp.]
MIIGWHPIFFCLSSVSRYPDRLKGQLIIS